MKIAVFSDSHGNVEHMLSAIESYRPDTIIHLGDMVRDADVIAAHFPHKAFLNVAGNCDYAPTVEDSRLVELEGVRIFMAHGHRHAVKFGLDAFANSVYCSGAKLGLFGHTHRAVCHEVGGIVLFNPGSCGNGGRPTYGQIEVKNGEIRCKIVEIEE